MSLEGEKPMTSNDRKVLETQIGQMAAKGLRCIAVAEIPNAGQLSELTESNATEFLGDISKYDKYE
jgi:magnesium-transporting ATPase (P-type)